MSPISRRQAAVIIAKAFAAGAPNRENMIAFAARQVDAEPVLLSRLADDVVAILGTRIVAAHHRQIAGLLDAHPALASSFGESSDEADSEQAPIPATATRRPTRISFVAAPARSKPPFWPIPAYNLPAIDTTSDLCKLLAIHPQRLEAWSRRWRQREGVRKESEQRYSAYFAYWQPKKRGGARLIEIPKPDLKQAQRRLLRHVIEHVDPHEAATGFRRGHSIITHAKLHANQPVVLKCDLQDFFASIRASKIHAIFRYMGYSETVAHAMTAIVTARASAPCIRAGHQYGIDVNAASRYRSDHLPQGAPTSPALANLAAFRLDLRLASLAEAAGAQYSRYADDIAFSGSNVTGIATQRFYLRVFAIAIEEGFRINPRKTRLMPQSQRQHVTGLVINQGANINRREFDLLKAMLTNVSRLGLESQNREQHPDFRNHLLGRIAFVSQVNPLRGARLRSLWDKLKP